MFNHYYLDIFGHKFTISGKYDSDNTINKKSIVLDKPYLFFKVYEKIGVTSEIQDIGEENGEYN